jgi:hypothetical protein
VSNIIPTCLANFNLLAHMYFTRSSLCYASMTKSISGPKESRCYYEWVWLKSGIVWWTEWKSSVSDLKKASGGLTRY